MKTLQRFLHDERGATAVEYALIAFAIAGAVTLIVITLGGKVRGLFVSAESGFPGGSTP